MLTKSEMETIIRWDEDPDSGIVVYTCSRKIRRALIAEGAVLTKVSRDNGKEIAWEFDLPKNSKARRLLMSAIPSWGTPVALTESAL